MVFSSIPFLYFFLPAVLLVYAAAPKKLKNVVLLVFSLLFYWWGEPKYALLMVFTVTFCYFAGIIIDKYRENKLLSRICLVVAVGTSLAVLFFFKYFNFVADSAVSPFPRQRTRVPCSLPARQSILRSESS